MNSVLKLSTFNSQLSISKGFTLVELIVAFGIASILATMGIASFASFNQRQQLAISQQDLANLFHVARSRALSQVKPSICLNNPIAGYKIILCGITSPPPSGACAGAVDTAQLHVVCPENADHRIDGIKFPSTVLYDTTGTTQGVFYFRVLSGGVEGAASAGTDVTLKHQFLGTNTKIITVFKDGKIIVR